MMARPQTQKTQRTNGKLKNAKLFIFDLDGVIYLGKKVLPYAREVISELRAKGSKIFFLTNNSAKSRRQYQRCLTEMNIPCHDHEIMTSAYATAHYLQQKYGTGKRALVVGGYGIFKELQDAGFVVEKAGMKLTSNKLPSFHFVVTGLNTDFHYKHLAQAQRAVLCGARLVATNRDSTYPVENGLLPGGGCLVAALETATSKKAFCVGKPNPYSVKLILRMAGVKKEEAVMVGDRLETDIYFGKRAGITTVMVLTGISTMDDARACPRHLQPDKTIRTLKELLVLFRS